MPDFVKGAVTIALAFFPRHFSEAVRMHSIAIVPKFLTTSPYIIFCFGIFDKDGTFVAKTWTEGDGLTPGKYKVMVACWKRPPTATGPPPISYVDGKYQSGATSDVTLEVAPDAGSQTVGWNITGPKG